MNAYRVAPPIEPLPDPAPAVWMPARVLHVVRLGEPSCWVPFREYPDGVPMKGPGSLPANRPE